MGHPSKSPLLAKDARNGAPGARRSLGKALKGGPSALSYTHGVGSNHHPYFFENNPKEQLYDWALQLKLFRICRSPGGMLDAVPDMFVARSSFPELKHGEDFLRSLGLEPESRSGMLNGIPLSLHRASRDDWNDVWF